MKFILTLAWAPVIIVALMFLFVVFKVVYNFMLPVPSIVIESLFIGWTLWGVVYLFSYYDASIRN